MHQFQKIDLTDILYFDDKGFPLNPDDGIPEVGIMDDGVVEVCRIQDHGERDSSPSPSIDPNIGKTIYNTLAEGDKCPVPFCTRKLKSNGDCPPGCGQA